MSGSVFDMTYSNYGRYLESNVFLQKSKPKKSETVSQKSKNKQSSTFQSPVPPTPGLPQQQPQQQQQSGPGGAKSLGATPAPTMAIPNKNNHGTSLIPNKSTASKSMSSVMDFGKANETGSAVFKSVERSKTRGFCHHFQREDISEIKYQPKYDLTIGRAPAFSMNKAAQSRVICDDDIHREKLEPEKDKVFAVCCKHPLFDDFCNSNPLRQHETNISLTNQSGTAGVSLRNSIQQKSSQRPSTSIEPTRASKRKHTHSNSIAGNENTNIMAANQTQGNTVSMQRRISQKPSSYLVGAEEENYQRKASMQLTRQSIAQQSVPSAAAAATAATGGMLGSGTPSPKAKNRSKTGYFGSEHVTSVEIMRYPTLQKGFVSPKQRFDIQLKKQTFRPNTVKAAPSRDEYRFNNFTLMKTNYKQRAHSFTSYTDRRVFEPKDNAPSYDIHKVNYDRLLTNDRHNRGNVSLESKPIMVIAKTKHEILSKTNDVLGASVRLDYPMKDYAFYQQSGVRRPNTTNFGKSSPRKKNVFPKPDQQFRDASLGASLNLQSIAWPGRKDHSVAYYAPV